MEPVISCFANIPPQVHYVVLPPCFEKQLLSQLSRNLRQSPTQQPPTFIWFYPLVAKSAEFQFTAISSYRTNPHRSRAYNQNLAFYAAFVLCLTSYIFVMYGGRAIRGDAAVLSEACAAEDGGGGGGDGGVPREAAVLWHVNTVLLVILGKLGKIILNSSHPSFYISN